MVMVWLDGNNFLIEAPSSQAILDYTKLTGTTEHIVLPRVV